jgi:two-component system, response regulator
MSHHPRHDVLYVENNPDEVELTIRAFERHKLANAIHVARDGAEALDALFGPAGDGPVELPCVVLLDLKLPKVSGLEVLARIRADERTRSVPVVVVTSSKEEQDIQKAYEMGANSYIVKPVDFETFMKAIGEVGRYWLGVNQPPM